MKIVVIEVQQDGHVFYLNGTSCLDINALVTDPTKAFNYFGNEEKLEKDLCNVAVEGDEIWARSGVRSDTLPQVVEIQIEIRVSEVSRRQGRGLHKQAA